MIATEDIGKDEVIIEIPSELVLSTKRAYYSPINQIFYENPSIFGKHVYEGEDNILNAYILYELGLGKDSFWYPMFQIWPKNTDILMNWEYDEIEYL